MKEALSELIVFVSCLQSFENVGGAGRLSPSPVINKGCIFGTTCTNYRNEGQVNKKQT